MRTLDMNTHEIIGLVELTLDQFRCDSFGTYWPEGKRVWNALGPTVDLHIRADHYEGAKELVLRMFPDAIIYARD